MYKALIFYFLGASCVFFQHNLQFINDWWKDKPVLTVLVFSFPIGIFYLKAWTYFVEYYNSVWSTRFLFLGLSYAIFPVLAYVFLNETPFTLKNGISVLLALIIILIQYKL